MVITMPTKMAAAEAQSEADQKAILELSQLIGYTGAEIGSLTDLEAARTGLQTLRDGMGLDSSVTTFEAAISPSVVVP